ncbi:MAG: GtrA family protein [Candidatus Portnoybacteria bacterium]|nr:GtrA family protein [Candidatus Portnoybacteria bacterium]
MPEQTFAERVNSSLPPAVSPPPMMPPLEPEPPAEAPKPKFLWRKDYTIAAVIGFLCAVLIFPIVKNLEIEVPFLWLAIVILPLASAGGMALAFWLGSRIKIICQLAKFVLVGALNTFFDWGILNWLMFWLAITSGPFYLVFKAISFLVATINSYFWNKFWTFKNPEAAEPAIEKKKTMGKEFLQFFVVSVIGLLLNVGLAHFIVNIWGVQGNVSEALWANVGAFGGTLAGLLWNFLGYKLVVFKK